MQAGDKILVTDGSAMIGAALLRVLAEQGFTNVVTNDFDLQDEAQVDTFFRQERPVYVFLAAGRHGGIAANQRYPAEFFISNMQVQVNVIHAAYKHGVKRLIYLASSCCYPKNCPQPMSESALMTGRMEPTSEAYSTAKISGIVMCDAYNRQFGTSFIPAIPSNLYGPGDDFSDENSHVLSALISRFHRAKASGEQRVTVWGSGAALREFLYVDDLARSCIWIMQHYREQSVINIAGNEELTIAELAEEIARVVGYEGEIWFDISKPDGAPRKKLDNTRLNAFMPQQNLPFAQGLAITYEWFLQVHN